MHIKRLVSLNRNTFSPIIHTKNSGTQCECIGKHPSKQHKHTTPSSYTQLFARNSHSRGVVINSKTVKHTQEMRGWLGRFWRRIYFRICTYRVFSTYAHTTQSWPTPNRTLVDTNAHSYGARARKRIVFSYISGGRLVRSIIDVIRAATAQQRSASRRCGRSDLILVWFSSVIDELRSARASCDFNPGRFHLFECVCDRSCVWSCGHTVFPCTIKCECDWFV